MGQKVNPNGLRVGVIKNWDSRWFAKDNVFGDLLVEDYKIRKDLKKRLYDAGVSEEVAREALRLASHKLPCKTKFVAREKNGGEA